MSPLEAPPKVYESKRDLWLVLLLWAGNLTMLVAAVGIWRSDLALTFRALYVVIMGGMTLFVLSLLYGTRYLLTDSELIAAHGPFRTVVPLAVIGEVRPSRSLLASPALSLDRIEIRRRDGVGSLLISPADREAFVADLKLRSPHLVSRFDRLVNKTAEGS